MKGNIAPVSEYIEQTRTAERERMKPVLCSTPVFEAAEIHLATPSAASTSLPVHRNTAWFKPIRVEQSIGTVSEQFTTEGKSEPKP